jgi:hypothetical protein
MTVRSRTCIKNKTAATTGANACSCTFDGIGNNTVSTVNGNNTAYTANHLNPKYEQLVVQYESSRCCNCQQRIADVQKSFKH